VLILGDSVVVFGGHGWDDGLNRAGAERYGLAGTGLLYETSSGDGFRLITQFGWITDPDAAPAPLTNFAVASHVYTTGTGSQRRIGVLVNASSALAGAPLELSAWGVSASGADVLRGAARLGISPFSTIFQSATQTLLFPAPGIDHVAFSIDGNLTAQPTPLDYFISGSDDSSYVYVRALKQDDRGITVTSVGLGGQSVRSLYTNMWTGGIWDAQGRAAFLDAIVQGGSGKLLVPIFEGFNDRNESQPSLTLGILPGNSPAAFGDNIDTLIGAVQADWASTGRPSDDLSFVIFGMYDINGDNTQLIDYSDGLRTYAQGTTGVSYLDLRSFGVSFDQGQGQGLFADGLHLNRSGTQFYSRRIFDVLEFARCPGDIADDSGTIGPDGQVSFGDFLALLGLIGPCQVGGIGCAGDIADDFGSSGPDGQVSFGDFLAMLGVVGPCD